MSDITSDTDLIRTKDADLSNNFIALGMNVAVIENEQQGGHSALFICLNEELSVYHFDNGVVNLTPASDDRFFNHYYHKKLDFIHPDESTIQAFIAHCIQIKKGSNLKFGYVFDGSLYDSVGNHFTTSNLPELATCVGFCINVI